MEPEVVPTITYKTREQLSQQWKLVNVFDVHEGIEGKPTQDSKYQEYVLQLRKLRKSQRENIERQIENRLDTSPKEALLEAARYSVDIGTNLLFELCFNPHSKTNTYDVYDYSEVVRLAGTEKGFLDAVENVLTQKPEAVYRIFQRIWILFPHERILQAVEEAGPHPGFLDNYKLLKKHFTPPQQTGFIRPFLNHVEHGRSVLSLFGDTDACLLFTEDEVRKAIYIALQGDISMIDPISTINYYMSQNIKLTPEELEQLVDKRIETFMPVNFVPHIESYLPSDFSTDSFTQKIVDTYSHSAQVKNLWVLRGVSHLLTPADRLAIVRETLRRDPFMTSSDVQTCEQLVSSDNLREILREVITVSKFPLDNRELMTEMMHTRCLTVEDKMFFVQRVIDSGNAELFLEDIQSNLNLIEFLGSGRSLADEIALNVFAHCDETKVAKKYRAYNGWKFIVSVITVHQVIESARSYSAIYEWINSLDVWAPHIMQEFPGYVATFLEKHSTTHGHLYLGDLPFYLKYIPEDRRQGVLHRAVECDPIFALHCTEFDDLSDIITFEEIVDVARQDVERIALAPKLTMDFWKNFRIDVPLDKQKALLAEGRHMYASMLDIKRSGLESELESLYERTPLSAREEREALAVFQCFALIKEALPHVYAQFDSLGVTVEESKKILFRSIAEILDVKLEMDESQASAMFFHAMESPGPFMTYVLQYIADPIYKTMLGEIFTAICAGKFDVWKFGPRYEESFHELQARHLIPQRTSMRQYVQWRNDGATNLFESLATDTSIVAGAVKKYVEDNVMHLEVTDTIDYLTHKHQGIDIADSLKIELSSVGARLAEIGKKIGSLKKQSTPEVIQQIADLRIDKDHLDELRKKLLRARHIARLMDLKPNEVASGYFYTGNTGEKRGERIIDSIHALRDTALPENHFVYDELTKMLKPQDTEAVRQNLTVTDSADPKIWIEIGENPVASCQSYNRGVMNECLLGYTDPNTKFLIVKNEKGNIIARSVLRLLSKENGAPALHIERVYSSSMSPSILKCMFSMAYKKAQEMGVPLLISKQSQGEEGIELDVQIAEGFSLTDVDYSLYSFASRAPYVYVDSAGGESQNGVYTMENLAEIHRVLSASPNI